MLHCVSAGCACPLSMLAMAWFMRGYRARGRIFWRQRTKTGISSREATLPELTRILLGHLQERRWPHSRAGPAQPRCSAGRGSGRRHASNYGSAGSREAEAPTGRCQRCLPDSQLLGSRCVGTSYSGSVHWPRVEHDK
jgi:hypothetical protein